MTLLKLHRIMYTEGEVRIEATSLVQLFKLQAPLILILHSQTVRKASLFCFIIYLLN